MTSFGIISTYFVDQIINIVWSPQVKTNHYGRNHRKSVNEYFVHCSTAKNIFMGFIKVLFKAAQLSLTLFPMAHFPTHSLWGWVITVET